MQPLKHQVNATASRCKSWYSRVVCGTDIKSSKHVKLSLELVSLGWEVDNSLLIFFISSGC